MSADRPPEPRLCLGAITGAHGVRGLVKIKPFTEDPADLTAYGPLTDEAGRRRFSPELLSRAKGQWIARLEGVNDRNAAEALAKTRLYIEKSALPAIEEEDAFYHADLIGLTAVDSGGAEVGSVRAVFDFGGGDVLEIARRSGGVVMVPFTRQAVPEVDIGAGRLVIDPAEEPAEEPAGESVAEGGDDG